MDSKKGMMAASSAAALLAVVALLARGGSDAITAQAKTKTVTEAEIAFSKSENEGASAMTGDLSKHARLTTITDENVTYVCTNAYASGAVTQWNGPFAMLLGKGYWSGNYVGGSIEFDLKSYKMVSAVITAKCKESAKLVVNGTTYGLTTGWLSIAFYTCETSVKVLKLETKTEKNTDNPKIFVSDIQLHLS